LVYNLQSSAVQHWEAYIVHNQKRILLFHKIPRIDDSRLASLFGRKVLADLVRKQFLSPEWAERILSWCHTGFPAHSRVRAKTKKEAELVGKYMIRPRLSLERLCFNEKEGQVCCRYGKDPQ
jgi:hypothetical protein